MDKTKQGALVTAGLCGVLIFTVLSFAYFLVSINNPLTTYIVSQNASFTPLGTQPQGEATTGLAYVIPAIAMTTLMVYGLKRNPGRWVKVLIGASFSIGSFLIAFVEYWWWLGTFLTMELVTILGGLFVLSYYVPKGRAAILSGPFKVWLCVGLAYLLWLSFPLITALAVCGAFAVWDVYAVFRGPLKTMIAAAKSEATPKPAFSFLTTTLMLDFGLGGIGFGDLVFYALMFMIATEGGALLENFSALAILSGVFISYYLLRARQYNALPGLPLPVLFFMLTLLVFVYA